MLKLDKIKPEEESRLALIKSSCSRPIDYSNTNATIDLSNSFEFAFSEVDINGCDFSNTKVTLPKEVNYNGFEIWINDSNVSNSGLCIPDCREFEFFDSDLSFVDLSALNIDVSSVIHGADTSCFLNTGARLHLPDGIDGKRARQKLKEAMMNSFKGCYVNGKYQNPESVAEANKQHLLARYNRYVDTCYRGVNKAHQKVLK